MKKVLKVVGSALLLSLFALPLFSCKEIDEINSHLSDMQDKQDALEKENKELLAKLEQQKAELDAKLADQKSEYESKITTLTETHNKELNKLAEDMNKLSEEYNKKVQALNNEIDSLTTLQATEKKALEEKIATLTKTHNDEVTALNNQISESEKTYKNKLSELTTKHDNEVKALNDELASLNETQVAEKKALEDKITNLNKKHNEEVLSLNNTLKETTDSYNNKLSELTTKHNEEITNLNNQIKSNDEAYKLDKAKLDKQINDLSAKHIQEVEKLNSDLTALTTKHNEELAATKKDYENKISSLEKENQSLTDRITELEKVKTYTVTFDAQNGTELTTDKADENKYVSKPSVDPIKTGYTFDGWYTENNTLWAFDGYPIVQDITLYAHYKPNEYKIYFSNSNKLPVSVTYDKSYYLDDDNKYGYTFKGYTYNNEPFTNGIYNYDYDITITSNWGPVFTITLDSNGGSKVDNFEALGTYTIDNLPIPTKEGSTFEGWYLNDELFTVPFDNRECEEFTLVAKWSKTFGDYNYIDFNDNTATIIGYTGFESDIAIPDTLNGKLVTEIRPEVFSNNYTVRKIALGKHIATIGDNAFANCTSLEEIVFNNGITHYGNTILRDCNNLKTIEIENSIKLTKLFSDYSNKLPNSLKEVRVLSSSYNGSLSNRLFYSVFDRQFDLELVGNWAEISRSLFENCNIFSQVIIPNSVTSIDNDAFYNCESLKNIYFKGTKEKWNSYNVPYSPIVKVYFDVLTKDHIDIINAFNTSINENIFAYNDEKVYLTKNYKNVSFSYEIIDGTGFNLNNYILTTTNTSIKSICTLKVRGTFNNQFREKNIKITFGEQFNPGIDYIESFNDTPKKINSDAGGDAFAIISDPNARFHVNNQWSEGLFNISWRQVIIVDKYGKICWMVSSPANGYGNPFDTTPNGTYYCHPDYRADIHTNPAFVLHEDYTFEIKVPEGGFIISSHGSASNLINNALNPEGTENSFDYFDGDERLHFSKVTEKLQVFIKPAVPKIFTGAEGEVVVIEDYTIGLDKDGKIIFASYTRSGYGGAGDGFYHDGSYKIINGQQCGIFFIGENFVPKWDPHAPMVEFEGQMVPQWRAYKVVVPKGGKIITGNVKEMLALVNEITSRKFTELPRDNKLFDIEIADGSLNNRKVTIKENGHINVEVIVPTTNLIETFKEAPLRLNDDCNENSFTVITDKAKKLHDGSGFNIDGKDLKYKAIIIVDAEGKITYMVVCPGQGYGGATGSGYYTHPDYASLCWEHPCFAKLEGYGPWKPGSTAYEQWELSIPKGGFAVIAHGDKIKQIIEALGGVYSENSSHEPSGKDLNNRNLCDGKERLFFDNETNTLKISRLTVN